MKLRSPPGDHIDEANVGAIDHFLVTRRPGYSNFSLQDNRWDWVQKQADGKQNISYTRKSRLGSRMAHLDYVQSSAEASQCMQQAGVVVILREVAESMACGYCGSRRAYTRLARSMTAPGWASYIIKWHIGYPDWRIDMRRSTPARPLNANGRTHAQRRYILLFIYL